MGRGELGGASIYILLCSDGSYYTGITRRSVEERMSEHAQGLMPGYTFTRRPVKLVFSERYERIVDARRDSASQSLLKTIVLRLEDYFLGAIAALMSRDAAGRGRRRGLREWRALC